MRIGCTTGYAFLDFADVFADFLGFAMMGSSYWNTPDRYWNTPDLDGRGPAPGHYGTGQLSAGYAA
jgi:hypothetical protein